MIDFIPLFAVAFMYMWLGAKIGNKINKIKKESKPIIFKTNLQEMIDTELYVADINNFTAKINSIVKIDKIGFSQNGKFYYTDKKI